MMLLAPVIVLAGLAHAMSNPTVRDTSGVQVVPGPGITGISSPNDIIKDVEGQVHPSALVQRSLNGRGAQGETTFCSNTGLVQTSDAQTLEIYLRGLPPTYECGVQQSQYRADCALGSCAILAEAGTARVFICLNAGQKDGVSSASVNCNLVANYVTNIIAHCNSNGMINAAQYITLADYTASNNALGTNARTLEDAYIFIG